MWVIAAASFSVEVPPRPPRWSIVSRNPGWRAAMPPISASESVASIAIGTAAFSAAAHSQSSVPSASHVFAGSARNP